MEDKCPICGNEFEGQYSGYGLPMCNGVVDWESLVNFSVCMDCHRDNPPPDECHWPDFIKNYSPILDCGHYFGADLCDISGELCKVKARKENCNMKGDQDGENDNSSNATG